MAKISKFEDIESWKKARRSTNEIYKRTSSGKFMRDFGLKDQIRRASISILSNIAEGFERGGDKVFTVFGRRKGLLRRSSSTTVVAFDQGYLSREVFEVISKSALEISQLLARFMKYLKKSELHSSKYR